ncbi:putative disease resistance protein RGA3 isoform X1 [Panicum miliaceum]|uniref:Disease resistance protein RGA3 isoform X1 n=1 Tax=Panicum miliaceum TaxID=4540 RepID=A0A3L6R5T3_PANMI|nr:putative disease resistance protein RGA3 isoform X1 [Panicum miliaceum]
MAGAVVGPIAGRLAALVTDETALLWGFKDDVEGMRKTMEKLQALKQDADRRESLNEGERRETVRVWIKNFKSAAYDVEDLLDELDAIKLMKQNQPKIKVFFSFYNPLLVRLTMVHKMKKVNRDLRDIEEEGHRLDLVPRDIPIWTAGEGVDNLNNLKQMLQYGARGSKIILTARRQQVVENLKLDDVVE